MKTKSETRKEIRVIGIPNEIFAKVVNDAHENMRSQSKQVIMILKQYYNGIKKS